MDGQVMFVCLFVCLLVHSCYETISVTFSC